MFVDTSSGSGDKLKKKREPRESTTPRVITLGIIKLFMVGPETVDIKFLTPPVKNIFDPRGPRPPPFTTS